jgi:hypothetical protein
MTIAGHPRTGLVPSMSTSENESVIRQAARLLRRRAIALERYMNGEKVTAMTAFGSHGGKLGVLDDLFAAGFAQTDVAYLTAEWLDQEDVADPDTSTHLCATLVAQQILGKNSEYRTGPTGATTVLGRSADRVRSASAVVRDYQGNQPVNAMIPTHSSGSKFAAFERLFALGFAQPGIAELVAEWLDTQDVADPETHTYSRASRVAKAILRERDED